MTLSRDRTAAVAADPIALHRHLSPDLDLHLFGTDEAVADISFDGKAALDLRQHTPASEGADFDPDVDPTGKWLVFASTRHSRHSHLYMKAVDGATLIQITDESADDLHPSFSPNGERIAFASNRGGQWDIWVVDASGRNPTQITSSPAAELHPSWSPDGRRLVFCSIKPHDSRGELWLVEVDNPGMKRLIGEGLFPEWSPKGDKIVYQKARTRGSHEFSIWTLDIRHDEVLYPTEVASSPWFALIAPCWSPDATQIAFAAIPIVVPASDGGETRSPRGARSEVGIVDSDGRCLQRLTSGYGESYSPTWSVDGRVYFTARLPSSETVWSIKPFRPTPLPEPAAPAGDRRAAAAGEKDAAP